MSSWACDNEKCQSRSLKAKQVSIKTKRSWQIIPSQLRHCRIHWQNRHRRLSIVPSLASPHPFTGKTSNVSVDSNFTATSISHGHNSK
jgi:hypothetical protein